MRNIKKFIEKNKLIFIFFIISLFIIVTYILTMDLPELFNGAEKWYNLLFQVSIGYIINFMFYITQIYIPNCQRDATVKKCISVRLNHIISDMKQHISSLATVYIKNHPGSEYTEEELLQLLNLKFSDQVDVLNASQTTGENFVYFTVREWIQERLTRTENDIDNLYKYYAANISEKLMITLEDILHSSYHTVMKILLTVPNDVDFSQCNTNYFAIYYELICQLEKIKKEDYS